MLVPTLLLTLAASPAETGPAAAPTTSPAEPRPRPLGPVGSGGIVLAAAGLGVAIAGIVRMTQPDVPRSELGQLETITFTDTRIQGGVVLGAGLAVFAAGTAMVAVDLAVHRKRSTRPLAIAPTLSPSMVGIYLRVRFSPATARAKQSNSTVELRRMR
jgi:hypothetical protein